MLRMEISSGRKEEVRVRMRDGRFVVRATPFSAEEIWRFRRPLQNLTEKKKEARQDKTGPKQDQAIRYKDTRMQRHKDKRQKTKGKKTNDTKTKRQNTKATISNETRNTF